MRCVHRKNIYLGSLLTRNVMFPVIRVGIGCVGSTICSSVILIETCLHRIGQIGLMFRCRILHRGAGRLLTAKRSIKACAGVSAKGVIEVPRRELGGLVSVTRRSEASKWRAS